MCVFGDHTFVPLTWMSKRQTAVPHCSTEIFIISLDAGLRSEGLFALQVRDHVLDVLSPEGDDVLRNQSLHSVREQSSQSQ